MTRQDLPNAIKTLKRRFDLLRLVGSSGRKGITATELHGRDDSGVDIRTIQRDLEVMAKAGVIRTKSPGKHETPTWVLNDESPIDLDFADDHGRAEKLELSPSQLKSSRVALGIVTLYEHARHLLHHAALADLKPIYERSNDILRKSHALEHGWIGKVVHGTQHVQLCQAKVSQEVLHAFQTAILEGIQVKGQYRSRRSKALRDMCLNPFALAYQDSSIYLICQSDDDQIIRKLPLQRFQAVEVLQSRRVSIPENFSPTEHVQKIHKACGPVRLKLRINEALRERLDESETPLTENQVLTPLGSGGWMLECDYEYTQGLEWWILGHGAAIEVLEPAQLRESISSCVRQMAQAYGHLVH
ncbi:WYL domain-containing protein [Pseudomonas sp. 148P]|uniref:WYL domain-containing protein n=1 Tax=Pseudomonas ulcerans TaxID=3115852 RepID=A0ABU7HXE9_9PSED|nr:MULTISPECIES: WYL domain-containing protein [unclassified Pseudomonas]MEE1924739.1 WYL domain-containing protein [Pseudomonas sp. 147P]MEE1936148.1 WYL domain-containing protein [Pseudomonas sp. 148P]